MAEIQTCYDMILTPTANLNQYVCQHTFVYLFTPNGGHWTQKQVSVAWIINWPNSQIPECTCSISHNPPSRCAHYCSGWGIVVYGTGACTFLLWLGNCGMMMTTTMLNKKNLIWWIQYVIRFSWDYVFTKHVPADVYGHNRKRQVLFHYIHFIYNVCTIYLHHSTSTNTIQYTYFTFYLQCIFTIYLQLLYITVQVQIQYNIHILHFIYSAYLQFMYNFFTSQYKYKYNTIYKFFILFTVYMYIINYSWFTMYNFCTCYNFFFTIHCTVCTALSTAFSSGGAEGPDRNAATGGPSAGSCSTGAKASVVSFDKIAPVAAGFAAVAARREGWPERKSKHAQAQQYAINNMIGIFFRRLYEGWQQH